jgi:diguanylate cyclase (GGDEF)-like protein/PAS domain S-box-containing protein
MTQAFSQTSVWQALRGWLASRLRAGAVRDLPAHTRVRLAMYSMLALVGLVFAFLAWQADQFEAVRRADAEIIQSAARQSTLTQHMGAMAALLGVPDGQLEAHKQALGEAINQSQSQSQALEDLLKSQAALQSEDDNRMVQALGAWQQSRERLWYRAQALLWHVERPGSPQLLNAVAAVQAEVDKNLQITRQLEDGVRQAAQLRSQRVTQAALVWGLVTLALLLLLALAIVEPTARAVSRQYRALSAQTGELRRLAMVAQRTSNAVLITDALQRVIWVNNAFERLNGYSAREAKGQRLTDLLRGEASDPVMQKRFAHAMRGGKGVNADARILTKDGQLRWVEADVQPILNADGRLEGWVVVNSDLTELRAQQQLLTLAVDGAGLGTWQWDIVTGEMTANDRLLAMMGYQRGQLEMHIERWNRLIHPEELDAWLASIQTHLANPHYPHRMELRLQGPNGDWTWLLLTGAVVVRSPAGAPLRMAGVGLDVNANKAMEHQLRLAASTDNLTQLPNRSVLLELIRRALARGVAQPGYHFAVLFMDFDRFKQVNDTLGHSVGDELLRQIAQRLQNSLRPGDAFVRSSDFGQTAARIGGDEFVVLLDDIRGDLDAQVVASRLLEVLAEPYQIGPHRVNSTASIGIVTTTHAATDADAVLRDADIAMYEAKRAGRGRYEMFDPSMRKRVRDDVAVENDLRQALDRGELFVVYQPVIDLTTGSVAGMEALARWRHPKRGLVSPVEFIAVAETSGLIAAIGHFVLETACRELAQMQAQLGRRAPPKMAVNVSRAQLRQAGFASAVLDVLRGSGVAPVQLQLEVTESLAAQDDAMQQVLQEIKALGVTLSLDDFGTGYSSLSCLHELPVDTVKIDRSFVSRAESSAYHRVLIEATMRMAQTLGLGTVAEGIETPQQAALMLQLGCDRGQGYLYSKPMEAAAMVEWIKARGSSTAAVA